MAPLVGFGNLGFKAGLRNEVGPQLAQGVAWTKQLTITVPYKIPENIY